ncbi:MAG: S24/S26 family peptidase [Fermentimonas sp.]|nr:S24/S26 family peptidase [Fermentimonas sp.]
MVELIIPNEVFFSHIMEEINAGNSVRIPSKGNSMLPFIQPVKDVIELSPLTENSIQKGNIVLAKTEENGYVVHRIERVESDKIILRGDGNINIRETCHTESVFAEVTGIYRGVKRITKSNLTWKLAKNVWFSSPLLRRIYLGIGRRIK